MNVAFILILFFFDLYVVDSHQRGHGFINTRHSKLNNENDFQPFQKTIDRLNKVKEHLGISNTSEPNMNEIGRSISLQPCFRYDTCKGRCLDYPESTATIAETAQFNCNCDPDCSVFGDCCWDYYDECVPVNLDEIHNDIEDKDSINSRVAIHGFKPGAIPNPDAFECVVVDRYSKEYFWIVTQCASTWPNDAVKSYCLSNKNDFLTLLPVQGDTGWTYKNAFCALCNYVDNFRYWHVDARCFQNAPEEVLTGDSAMISYYLLHFCNIRLFQDSTKLDESISDIHGKNDSEDSPGTRSHNIDLIWTFPLRRCDKNVINKCPDNYHDDFIKMLCEDYQSIVIHREYVDGVIKHLIFKNPICAYCHGIGRIYNDAQPVPMPDPASRKQVFTESQKYPITFDEIISNSLQNKLHGSENDKHRELECPVWLWMTYYDLPYWAISRANDAKSMLPIFNTNKHSKSSWTPPSFSMVLHFRKDGTCEIDYTEQGNSSKTITPDTICTHGEIYDPFYATCRPVVCQVDQTYNDNSCTAAVKTPGDKNIHTGSNDTHIPLVATVTLTIEVPRQYIYMNESEIRDSEDTTLEITSYVSTLYNISIANITVVNFTVIDTENERPSNMSASGSENTNNGNTYSIVFTFALLEPDEYTDEEIIEFAEEVNKLVQFQRLVLEADLMIVVVLSTPLAGQLPLICSEGRKKLQYNREQYEIIHWEDRNFAYINSTEEYYPESEYQFLDWTVEITENGIDRTYVDDSRIVVCAEITEVPFHDCGIYIPLNQSEYVLLDDGSLYLTERNLTIPEEEYINYEDSYAVCGDEYLAGLNKTQSSNEVASTSVWMNIVVWITFGLSMLSLLALAVTFITYLLFKDLRTVGGCCIMNLAVAQFSAIALFMFGAKLTSNSTVCATVTILLHFLFLSIFFWNNVMAFDVWRTFGKGLKNALRRSVQNRLNTNGNNSGFGRTVLKYMLYAWGIPAIFVGVAVGLEFGVENISVGYRGSDEICWIANTTANIVMFGVPVLCIILINAVLFGLSIHAIRKSAKAPYRNVGKNMMFRRKLASVSDEIRSQADTDVRCDKYKRSTSSCDLNNSDGKNPRSRKESTSLSSDTDLRVNKENTDTSIFRISSSQNQANYQNNVSGRRISISSPKGARSNVGIYIKMSTVMGFTWFIGFAAAFTQLLIIWLVFEISVPLQGIFIFWAFICQKRIIKRYKALLSTCGGSCRQNISTAEKIEQVKQVHEKTGDVALADKVFEICESPKKKWRGQVTDVYEVSSRQKHQINDQNTFNNIEAIASALNNVVIEPQSDQTTQTTDNASYRNQALVIHEN